MQGVLFASYVAACGRAPQPPVPLIGPAADVRALAGQWEGSYWSAATGRSSSISFTLTAQGDSAAGEVVMIPRGFARPLQAWDGPTPPAGTTPARPAVLTINFVRVAAGWVSGSLAPYADPESGTRLFTTFQGTLRGDTIEGSYATHAVGGDSQPGQWKVTRRKS